MSSPAGHAPRNIVLAHSGGVDASCIFPWLKVQNGNVDVISTSVPVELPDVIFQIEANALARGAANACVIDAGKVAAQRQRRSQAEFLEVAR